MAYHSHVLAQAIRGIFEEDGKSVSFCKAEVADLTAQKDRLYWEVRKLKEEVAEAETVKRCVEQAMPPTEQRKEKSKTQDISL